jgi:UDP-N-acetylglucosamine diphosphorylase / glucose-1-phosphate thymidylyltransferase / UDP-N-acetylgalactosamine diphosphorylase / glucosamine-1-phosphate N-acetyltransferase / galactosamine-1-phosphate N-acetyltransferase
MLTNIQKAVLLAAGRGTRMRDLTEALPKPMLDVRGKPVLQHIIEGLRDNGLTSLLVVVGWRAEVVKEFFGDGSKLGVAIQYETQTIQDGTGRVVALARKFVGDDAFLLSYGDILVAPENYCRISDALSDAEAVLSVKRSDDVSQGGAVFVNDKFELIDLREKPKPGEPTSPWYNAGVYAFRASIFDYIEKLRPSPRGEYELTDAIRNLALDGKKVQAIEIAGDWVDVRDPEILSELNREP